jgi:hypothetical protein
MPVSMMLPPKVSRSTIAAPISIENSWHWLWPAFCVVDRCPGRLVHASGCGVGSVSEVEITEQANLCAVVDDLDVDIQHLLRDRCVSECGWIALRFGESGGAEAADATDPDLVLVIELSQCFLRGAGVAECRFSGGRPKCSPFVDANTTIR